MTQVEIDILSHSYDLKSDNYEIKSDNYDTKSQNYDCRNNVSCDKSRNDGIGYIEMMAQAKLK